MILPLGFCKASLTFIGDHFVGIFSCEDREWISQDNPQEHGWLPGSKIWKNWFGLITCVSWFLEILRLFKFEDSVTMVKIRKNTPKVKFFEKIWSHKIFKKKLEIHFKKTEKYWWKKDKTKKNRKNAP